MRYVWLLAAAASLFTAIAELFLRDTTLTALGPGLLAVVFAVAAMRHPDKPPQ